MKTNENLIAIGQGISSPNSTSTVNYSNGFTSENPVGVLYQNGSRATLKYDQNDSGNSKGYGAEVGYGSKGFGVALESILKPFGRFSGLASSKTRSYF